MTDEELIARLREHDGWVTLEAHTHLTAADRIEELVKERDQHWDSFVHWRKQADDLAGQLAAAQHDAKEAEAYVEELEAKVKSLTKHHANMADPRYWEGRYRDEKNLLAKAVKDRDHWSDVAGREGVCMTCRGPNGAPEPYGCTDCLNTGYCGEHHNTVADLEAKLAKAVDALEYYAVEALPWEADDSLRARTTLAEISSEAALNKGESHD